MHSKTKQFGVGLGTISCIGFLSVVVFKNNKIIIIIGSRKGTNGLTHQFPCFIFFRLFSCSSYTPGAFTIYIGEHRLTKEKSNFFHKVT